MTATIITHTTLGGPIGAGSANHGAGLVWGLYEMTSTENDDWIILAEFEEILFVSCKSEATGALADEAVTIDETTTNKLVFTAGSTDTIRVLVFGTPAVESD